VNGDGFDDVVIGSGAADQAYVVFGKAGGFSATLDPAKLDGTNGFTVIIGDDPADPLVLVNTAGDVNSDGYDDLLIAAPESNPHGKDDAGKSYVLFGKAGGFSATFDLSTVDGTNGFLINGIEAHDLSGRPVKTAGDVNGDGFDDLLIAAGDANPDGHEEAGQSYVVFGRDFTGAVTHPGTPENDLLVGTAGPEVLVGGQGADELVGSGGADVFRGGEGDDIIAIGDLDFARLVGGRGNDTLRLDTSGVTLDLTNVPDNRIVNVEAIDVTGSGPNALILDVQKVLNISSESNTLLVLGDSDDAVNIGAGWSPAGTDSIDGTLFDVFTHAAATLKLAQPVAILGDMDLDGNVDFDDITALVLGLQDPASYEQTYGVPASRHGDIDRDGDADFDDIPRFVTPLGGVPLDAGVQVAALDTNTGSLWAIGIGDVGSAAISADRTYRYDASLRIAEQLPSNTRPFYHTDMRPLHRHRHAAYRQYLRSRTERELASIWSTTEDWLGQTAWPANGGVVRIGPQHG